MHRRAVVGVGAAVMDLFRDALPERFGAFDRGVRVQVDGVVAGNRGDEVAGQVDEGAGKAVAPVFGTDVHAEDLRRRA